MSQPVRVREVQRILEALLADSDFIELSSRTKTLNVFEAVGATRQELRHSNFLAFLLDPSQPHGLDSDFLRGFLVNVTRDRPLGSSLNSLEFRLMDLETVEVRREWRHIDLLILDEENRWVCAIENKVKSSEHGDQLDRYLETVSSEFSDFRSIYVYLTPDGAEPSNEAYIPISYEMVLDTVEIAERKRRDSLTERAAGILNDYQEIIRRYVVMESEVAEACRNVYRKHKEAIDLIVEHIPSVMDIAKDYIEGRCASLCDDFDLLEDDHGKSIVRVVPGALDVEGLRVAHWTSSSRILLIQVDFRYRSVRLTLTLGKGDPQLRRTVFDWLKVQSPPFVQVSSGDDIRPWQRLYECQLFTEGDLDDLFHDEGQPEAMKALEDELRRRLRVDLSQIMSAIQRSDWYQEAAAAR